MIIIRLEGGLGNQLFQYAFGRSLSYNLDTELFLDVSLYSHRHIPKHIIFGLHSFNIKGLVGYYPYVEKTSIGINHTIEHDLSRYVEGLPFPDKIHDYKVIENLDIVLPTYFQGWYQNQIDDGKNSIITENFFKINNKLIHEDLKYSLPLSHNSQLLFEDMKKYDSIALHIRHGDYVDHPRFGFCTKEYYQNAIGLLGRLDNPKFYIFTEDPDWVGDNLKINFPYEVIRFNEKNNTVGRGYAELLKLMSLCEHFIIANSTFSWWAAWLCENEHKIIISPKPWFQDRTILETDTIDNVKTINLKNDYVSLFENSDKILYEMNLHNMTLENIELIKEGNYFKINAFDSDSKLFLRNILPKNSNSKILVKFSLKSNCFNALGVYYKINNEDDYCKENSFNLYYYKDEEINHCLLLPSEALLNEIMIKPYVLKRDDDEFIKIDSIIIKEFIE